MRFKNFKYRDKSYIDESKITKILIENGLSWLVDSEFFSADIEILNNTIIWNDGIFLSGDWNYGIFKNGEFYGKWNGGIFERGLFRGNWIDGINLSEYTS